MKLRKDNTSGCKGVHWFKKTKKWNVRISYKGRRICIGHFKDLKEAIKEREMAEIKYHII